MNKIRIVVVDDHKILRIGLRAMLDPIPDMELVHEASGFEDFFSILNESVDVILMDVDLGDGSGVEATRIIKQKFPKINVLALSMHEEPQYISDMIQAGASGYLMKDSGSEEIVQAIRSVASGGKFFSAKVSMSLMNAMSQETRNKTNPTGPDNLTQREIEVLRLIVQEMSNAEIAEKLFISVRTVDSHRRNLMEKLNVKNTAGLVKYAIQKNYV